MKQLTFFLLFILMNASLFGQNADIEMLRKINLGRDRKLDNTFVFISNSVTPISVLAPVSVFFEGYSSHDSILKNKGVLIGATLCFSAAATVALKYGVNRKRPFVTYPDIQKVADAGSLSFPSGHTSDAFATATSLSLAFPKWYVITPSFLWACSVGYSRMDLGVHYPSDVMAGAIVGAGSAFLCYKANQWIHKHKS
jgi:membrane-associated phospholipid phosphatase